ncbi:MAG: polyprenyl synthetase family protein [Anaerolineae bacterium]|nr:polyprenyl synthetase family protein [Anaerolineae bacterium]
MLTETIPAYLTALDSTMRALLGEIMQHDEPGFGVMLRYALGWSDDNDVPYQHPTGKRLRPILLLLTAGERWPEALPAAAAVEFLHNFSLIHDDVQDDSPTRHSRPTVWKVWGIPNAINAGDALFTASYAALASLSRTLPAEQVVGLWHIFNATNLELTRGQHLDMRFEHQTGVPVEAYISMIKGKTAALLSACARMGALIGGSPAAALPHYAAFGLNIGIAFQIRDDILGIWGDPAVTGKSAATDIISRKKSFPVLYGLSHSSDLAGLYARAQFSAEDVRQAVALLDAVQAKDYSRQQETIYYERAMNALHVAAPSAAVADGLRAFVDLLFQRSA